MQDWKPQRPSTLPLPQIRWKILVGIAFLWKQIIAPASSSWPPPPASLVPALAMDLLLRDSDMRLKRRQRIDGRMRIRDPLFLHRREEVEIKPWGIKSLLRSRASFRNGLGRWGWERKGEGERRNWVWVREGESEMCKRLLIIIFRPVPMKFKKIKINPLVPKIIKK